jgi:hypothetical protein
MKKTIAATIVTVALLATVAIAVVPDRISHPTPSQVLELRTYRVDFPDLRTLPVPPSTLNRSHVIIRHGSR